jgi:acyl transferase domain-containing protein
VRRSQDIAIIGISCRAPGARDYEAFWDILISGAVHVGPRPPERPMRSRIWDEAASARLEGAATWGGWLEEVDRFDDHLFQIPAREARAIDPQHRLLLEESWCALQDAGLEPRRPGTSAVGVFVGLCAFDYALLGHEAGAALGPYSAIGGALCLASNRISHALGFDGPSLTVDAACASSLVATHLACRALAAGECDLALAGGANLVLTPSVNVSFQAARMLSPSGSCRPFDVAADGYVRSEAAGMLVLRRLEDARTGGDPIHAVIAASAVNQDGRTRGITVPSASAQERLVRTCWEAAGLSADDITFVEAHGTGTPTGDPIEIEALSAALKSRAPDREPCWMGSLKGNVGHAEAAAGVLSLVKAALALSRRVLPRHVCLREPIGGLAGALPRLRVATSCVSLGASDPPGAPLHGGVSAFGFGGTNCHVVLRAPPVMAAAPLDRPVAVTLSAHDEGALRALCADWATYLESASPEQIAAAGRLSMRAFSGERLRVAALGETPGALAEALRRAATEAAPSGMGAAILRVAPSEAVDLLAEPARARIVATRAAEDARAAEACMLAEIESLLRSLFPDAVTCEEAARAGETVLLVGGERAAACTQAVDADRAASLPVLLEFWRAGLALNAAPLAPGPLVRATRLPGFCFAKRSHWHTHLPAPGSVEVLAVKAARSDILRLDAPYLAEHRIIGEAIVPGASIVVAVLEATRPRLFGSIEMRDLIFETALRAEEAARGVRLTFRPRGPDTIAFELTSAHDGGGLPVRYASGTVVACGAPQC